MKQFEEQGCIVNICTDIKEWAKEFYGMPENAILENAAEVENECMGFADVDSDEIWLFIPKDFNEYELEKTIAHEVGHLMEFCFGFEYFDEEKRQEEKANHYEKFYDLVKTIAYKTKNIVKSSYE